MKRKLLAILVIALSTAMMAQWPEKNGDYSILPDDITDLYGYEMITHTNGDTYFVYDSPQEGGIRTYLQILDKDGRKKFPEPLLISAERTRSWIMINQRLFVDRDGNALISVSDCRNAPLNAPAKTKVSPTENYASGIVSSSNRSLNYSIYKVAPDGTQLWGDKGIDLDEGHSYEIQAKINMIQLEDGSYVFAWMKAREEGAAMAIQLQRVSSDGTFLWENVQLADDVTPYQYPYLLNAGNNQVILVYAKGTNRDIMVRKIDFEGTPVWSEDVRVYRGGFPDIPLQVIVKAYPDPKGGVFVTWYDDRLFTNIESAYTSYVTPDGRLGYTAGEEGQKIGYAGFRSFASSLVYDTANDCAYVAWRETTPTQNFQRLMGQKLSMTGELMWGSEGVEIQPWAPALIGYYSVREAGAGQFAAFYMLRDSITAYGDVTAYATLVKGEDGSLLWNGEKVFITGSAQERSDLTSGRLVDGQWIVAWEGEERLDEGTTAGRLYAQKVSISGQVGGESSLPFTVENEGFMISSNPVSDRAYFLIDSDVTGTMNISIYNLSGSQVAGVCQQTKSARTMEIEWNVRESGLTPGVYLAVLTTPTGRQTLKVVVK